MQSVGRRLGLLVLAVCLLVTVFLPDVVQIDVVAAGENICSDVTELCFNFIHAEAAFFIQGSDVQESGQIRVVPMLGTLSLMDTERQPLSCVLTVLSLCAAASALQVIVYVHKKDGRKRGSLLYA